MNKSSAAAKAFLTVFINCIVANIAYGGEYFVASDGTYEGAPEGATVYTTVDEAITAAGNNADVIYVEPGTYSTTAQWGPNLKAKLIGTGTTRDEVIIQSGGTYRTLRMAAGSWLENVTVVGITEFSTNADRGGSIEISGGTVTNCVIRDGHSNYASARSGGNLFMTAGLVENCVISNGNAKSRGGNINMEGGTVRNCLISDANPRRGAATCTSRVRRPS